MMPPANAEYSVISNAISSGDAVPDVGKCPAFDAGSACIQRRKMDADRGGDEHCVGESLTFFAVGGAVD